VDASELDLLLVRLLKLSRLTLSEGEREEFARKFSALLEFVDAVRASGHAEGVGRDAAGAGALSYLDALPLREDSPREFDWGDDFAHRYVVPLVVGDEEAGGAEGAAADSADFGEGGV
jgi:Asp-tRNA(Asn)/Glu-tRNA(Gln) amidotransferase C subunit